MSDTSPQQASTDALKIRPAIAFEFLRRRNSKGRLFKIFQCSFGCISEFSRCYFMLRL